ncbi:MAG: hypothetical protein GXY67_06850 [Clostridiales bacterium]|nr:hypothetical protein [Clostridiales bacterium]
MTCRILEPARLHGSVQAPPAIGEALRALLLASLGRGPCRFHGLNPPLVGKLREVTGILEALGSGMSWEGDVLQVEPVPSGTWVSQQVPCHVCVDTEALLLMVPVLWAQGRRAVLRLRDEPEAFLLKGLQDLSRQAGTVIARVEASQGQSATIEVQGKLTSGSYEMDGSLPGMLISGMLIALSHAADQQGQDIPSRLTVTGSLACRAQVDRTLEWMKRFGRCYQEEGSGVFLLECAQGPYPEDVCIPGDWSKGAALLCANALGSGVVVENLRESGEMSAFRGEARILDMLRQMGLLVFESWENLYVTSPSRARLLPLNADCRDMVDLVPVLALLCTQACGESTLWGMRDSGHKNRKLLEATVQFLTRMEAQAQLSDQGDALILQGPIRLCGGVQAEVGGDSRMAMLLALAALIAQEPITVSGMEILEEFWPGFLEDYQALGGRVS